MVVVIPTTMLVTDDDEAGEASRELGKDIDLKSAF